MISNGHIFRKAANFTCCLVLLLLIGVSPSRASDVDLLISCGTRRFVDLNSDSLVIAKFNREIANSLLQYTASGSVSYESAINDLGNTRDGAGFDLKLSKPLWNFSASDLVDANEIAKQSAELKLRAGLFDHLLLINSRMLDVRLILIERSVIDAQVKELEDLGKFADRLMRSRVIDPADALLVKENLIRFQLRQLEIEEAYNNAITNLAVDSGIQRERFKSLGIAISNTSLATVSTEFQQARSRLRELNTKTSAFPQTLAAVTSQAALSKEFRSVERTWYPKLLAEAGLRRSFAPVVADPGQTEGFLGLALNFSLPTRVVSAELERIRSLKEIESERERRSQFNYKNLLTAKFDQIGILLNQFKTAIQRKENLERLLALQLVKFKSGKLSFLNVNDVMLSLLEARRQAGSSRARILAIDDDAEIVSAVLDHGDGPKRKCE